VFLLNNFLVSFFLYFSSSYPGKIHHRTQEKQNIIDQIFLIVSKRRPLLFIILFIIPVFIILFVSPSLCRLFLKYKNKPNPCYLFYYRSIIYFIMEKGKTNV